MKDYREKELKNLTYIFAVLFILWCTPLLNCITSLGADASYATISLALESTIISGAISTAIFLFDCLISSKTKDKLVGFYMVPRLGEVIFSQIEKGKINDDRFTAEDAKSKYNDIISDMPIDIVSRRRYENSKWYRIYVQHQEKAQVVASQEDYLICRNLYVATLIWGVLYIISMLAFRGVVVFSKKFLLSIIIVLLLTNVSTNTKMKRFVTTVIAVDIAECKNDDGGT